MGLQAIVVNRSKMMMMMTRMTRTVMMVKKVRCVAGKKVSGHTSFTMKISQVFWDQ